MGKRNMVRKPAVQVGKDLLLTAVSHGMETALFSAGRKTTDGN